MFRRLYRGAGPWLFPHGFLPRFAFFARQAGAKEQSQEQRTERPSANDNRGSH